MSTQKTVNDIRTALTAALADNFRELPTALLSALGYNSDRTLAEQTGKPADFIRQFPADNPGTQSEDSFLNNAQSVSILFQFTSSEIQAQTQRELFQPADFDTGNARSFLFAAVELNGNSYHRGQYAAFTRELNKHIQLPMVALFRTAANRITLAFVHRRPNRRDPNRDVLGSVSLIREIDPANPHRAHLDILGELSLPERLRWMDAHGKPRNFDGLLDAWLDALNTEELNRRFYRDLFAWFERAVNTAKFPTGEAKTLSAEEHVIRLITRLMFVWFIKEKGLVAGDLFIENRATHLLKDYDREDGNSYYRAVLQNLFFATLNTEIDQRGFSNENDNNDRDFSRYHYRNEMREPSVLLALFNKTPFINGGLFDCLDNLEDQQTSGYYIDCFSDVHYSKLSIPNQLFFSTDDHNLGLIDLFNRYKFTVEENTPAEREVALDPELLGKVFENLLAAFNPETRENVRKQTGSYYTPRAVVDYMVDEALVTTLAQGAAPADGDIDFWQERLHCLVDYDDAFADAEELFTPTERATVVRTIARTKALDPAVGSGAFPMGILHKLTLALRRLDGDNELWRELQQEIATDRAGGAFDIRDQQGRDAELAEISNTFQRYSNDFGRKLYLIQNSIYGVDIQPVATQIAKLRFFISLAIEQEPTTDAAENYGIKPLPNLETRFVAANSLLGLSRPVQMRLGQTDAVKDMQRTLDANRERHFNASTLERKLHYRQEDERLRKELAAALREADFSAGDANKIAAWDPYDQNASANWFDAEYMFGVTNGFDIVIGNPPYRQVPKGTYSAVQFPYSEGKDKGKQNLYKLFVEQAHNLNKNDGVSTLIVQSSLMCDLSSAATRQLLLENTQLDYIIEFPEKAHSREAQVFTTVTQGTCIYQCRKAVPNGKPVKVSIGNDADTISDLRFAPIAKSTITTLYPGMHYFPRIRGGSVAILEKLAADKTIKPLGYYADSIIQGDLNLTTHKTRFSKARTTVRLLRGRNVTRFAIRHDNANEYCQTGFLPSKIAANSNETFLISQEVMNQQAERRLNFALTTKSSEKFLWGHSVNKTKLKNQTHSKSFLALLNSKFMDWYFRITSSNTHIQGYELEKLPIPEMADVNRERLDDLSTRILAAKSTNHEADTAILEAEIDQLVYTLYRLTEDEITIISGRAN